jgi:hypothetical protein
VLGEFVADRLADFDIGFADKTVRGLRTRQGRAQSPGPRR